MIVSDFSIRKVDRNDPRHPTAEQDLYLFTCETADQGPLECPMFVPAAQYMTAAQAANMLRAFASALDHADKKVA